MEQPFARPTMSTGSRTPGHSQLSLPERGTRYTRGCSSHLLRIRLRHTLPTSWAPGRLGFASGFQFDQYGSMLPNVPKPVCNGMPRATVSPLREANVSAGEVVFVTAVAVSRLWAMFCGGDGRIRGMLACFAHLYAGLRRWLQRAEQGHAHRPLRVLPEGFRGSGHLAAGFGCRRLRASSTITRYPHPRPHPGKTDRDLVPVRPGGESAPICQRGRRADALHLAAITAWSRVWIKTTRRAADRML